MNIEKYTTHYRQQYGLHGPAVYIAADEWLTLFDSFRDISKLQLCLFPEDTQGYDP